jgi:hypothetical protein
MMLFVSVGLRYILYSIWFSSFLEMLMSSYKFSLLKLTLLCVNDNKNYTGY